MKVTVNNTRTILDDKLRIQEAKYTYEKFNGEMSDEVRRVVVQRDDAVVAIVYHTDTKKVLMANQFRYAAHVHGNGWIDELMAGVMDEGETPEETLARELEEELGYKPAKAEKIQTFYSTPGYSIERMHLFYVEVNDSCKTTEGGGMEEENEDIKLVSYSIEEVKRKLENKEWIDAKTIIGCYYLLNKLMV